MSFHGVPDFEARAFAWTLRALSGVLKASSGPPRPRFGASSDRIREDLHHERKQPETTP